MTHTYFESYDLTTLSREECGYLSFTIILHYCDTCAGCPQSALLGVPEIEYLNA